jgi:hypothetical protein
MAAIISEKSTAQATGRYLYAIVDGAADQQTFDFTGLEGGLSIRSATARSPPSSATCPTARSGPSGGGLPRITKCSST